MMTTLRHANYTSVSKKADGPPYITDFLISFSGHLSSHEIIQIILTISDMYKPTATKYYYKNLTKLFVGICTQSPYIFSCFETIKF